VTPEKLVDFGMMLTGACDTTDDDMEGNGLFGLSPGIRLCVAMVVLDGRWAMSDAEMLWESLLDGACGRPIIFRDAICDSEARFTGLYGADVLLNWRCGCGGTADLTGGLAFAS
jgi:hypothetical protein